MALSRLLQAKSRHHLQRVGLVDPAKWWRYCTSSGGETHKSSSQPKKRSLAKEQKAAAVESFVTKYMETHPGIFPKVTHVHNNVGGSWNTLKDILTNLKEKMLANPHLLNHTTNDTSNSTVDATASEVNTTHNSADIGELGEATSDVENMINATDFECVPTCSSTDNTELIDFESYVQSSKSSGTFSEDMTGLDNASDRSKQVESKNVPMKPDIAISNNFRSAGDKKPESEKLSCFNILTEGTRTFQEQLASTGHQHHLAETKMMTSSQKPSEVGGKSRVSFRGPQNVLGIADLFMKRMTDQAAGEMTGEENDSFSSASPKCLDDDGEEKSFDIMGLIDCIRELPKEKSNFRSHDNMMSNKTDQTSNKGAIRGMCPEANSQRSDSKGRKTSLNAHSIGMETNNIIRREDDPGTGALFEVSEDSEESGADSEAFDHIRSKPSPDIPLQTSKQGSDDNKVLVRFLHASVNRWGIESLFKDCGFITKVEFHTKGGLFKFAWIYFKTKEGMQNALKRTGFMVNHISLVVEAACSTDNIPNKTWIPNLIGYPEVPASLVKNPTRTVMIKLLTPDISSLDIEEALAFCGSKICGFFFGSSSSVAYVELETEEAKQRALKRHSICVSGKQLQIFRIDAPRTTVVRISNLNYLGLKNQIDSVCESYGQVDHVNLRSKNIVDVHYNLAEWPNMLKILNGLNGLSVCGTHLVAQHAPVFPPVVLKVLWKCPDERRRLRDQIQSLLQKLGEYPTARRVASMTNEYYRMAANE